MRMTTSSLYDQHDIRQLFSWRWPFVHIDAYRESSADTLMVIIRYHPAKCAGGQGRVEEVLYSNHGRLGRLLKIQAIIAFRTSNVTTMLIYDA